MDLAEVWLQLDLIQQDSETQTQPSFSEWICDCGGTKVMGFSDGNGHTEHCLPTCTLCGKIDKEYISDEPEWRGGMDDDGAVSDPSRCGAPMDDRFSEMWSLGSKMTVGYHSSYAQKKLARIDFHTSMNHKDRSLFHNYADIEKAGTNLPKYVISEAQHMFKSFTQQKLTRGSIRMGIKANCLLQACKQNNIARTVDEIAEMFRISAKDITRTSDLLREFVKPTKNEITMASNIIVHMISKFSCIEHVVLRKLTRTCINKCEQIQENPELLGRTPKTISATIIVIMTEEYVDKNTACVLCDVSYPTVKKLEDIIRRLLVI
jgi:transcription initiation factor TFIIB